MKGYISACPKASVCSSDKNKRFTAGMPFCSKGHKKADLPDGISKESKTASEWRNHTTQDAATGSCEGRSFVTGSFLRIKKNQGQQNS